MEIDGQDHDFPFSICHLKFVVFQKPGRGPCFICHLSGGAVWVCLRLLTFREARCGLASSVTVPEAPCWSLSL